jgi:hypothetical protein
MGGGGKGGSSSETKLPEWYEDAAKNQIAQAQKVSKQGYVPFQGGDVAAFTPTQQAGMQSINDWSAAFNTPGQAPVDAMAGIPKPQIISGVPAYSSYGGYMDEMAKLEKVYPGIASYIKSFSIDPKTGTGPNPPQQFDKGGKPTPTPVPKPPPVGTGGPGPSPGPDYVLINGKWVKQSGGGNDYGGGHTSGH